MATNTMRAFGYSRHGDASVQQLLTVPVPEIGAVPSGIRIKTHACAFNPIDYKRRGGAMKMVVPEKVWPVILGYDVAGTVESVGSAVTKFKPGDEVYARLGGAKEYPGRGTCAEYTLGTEDLVSKKPSNMSFEEAAGVPLAAMTALQMLRKAGLKQGDAVLVTAGAGGVGHYAIQIAKALGAGRVVATASAAKHPLLKELGCDEVIDYRTQSYTQLFADRPFDIGFDNVSEVPQLCKVVKVGGHVVSNTQGFSGRSFSDAGVANVNWVIRGVLYLLRLPAERAAAAAKVTFSAIFLRANAKDLDFLTGLIEEGKLRSIVKVYEGIEKAGEAMAALEDGRATGKVVVKIV